MVSLKAVDLRGRPLLIGSGATIMGSMWKRGHGSR